MLLKIILNRIYFTNRFKGVFNWEGGGFSGLTPPPFLKYSDCCLKSEGKEVERKIKQQGLIEATQLWTINNLLECCHN